MVMAPKTPTSDNTGSVFSDSVATHSFENRTTSSSNPDSYHYENNVSKVKNKNDSDKDIQYLPRRKHKMINKMRQELERSTDSSTSFTVSFRSNPGSQSRLLQYPSEVRLKSGNQSSTKLKDDLDFKVGQMEIADDPFAYQQFYEVMTSTNSSSTPKNRPQRESSALELRDLGKLLQERRERGNQHGESSSSNGSSNTDTQGNGNTSDIEAQYQEVNSSNESNVAEDSDDLFSFNSEVVKFSDYRWGNILGLALLCAGLVTFVIFMIAKDLAESHRPRVPMTYERLTDYVYPQLSAIRTSMVDPDTQAKYHHKVASDGKEWELVFSDEFAAEGRDFYSKNDQFFEAADIHYAATNDLEWYSPDAISTANGTLNIRLDAMKNNGLHYRSGMLQSWNKMCFTQGLVEVSARLPGSFESKGFWPGIWSLGNLARPGYMASTDGVWPYTYHACDAGITPNQSSPDGLSTLPGQRLNSCTCRGEDHPNRGVGRGAPEIDILEGAFTEDLATVAQTLQIAPFDPWWIPDYDHMAILNKTTSYMNSYVGTSQQEAISVMTTLNETWFEKANQKGKELKLDSQRFQTYSVEYRSDQRDHEDNYISFSSGPNINTKMLGSMLHPEGNIGWREISKEPMSMVFNLGLSYAWSDIQWATLNFPATLEIDYIRIYQPKGKISVTCDPEGYPTTRYIEKHLNAYMNANLTSWADAGYKMPRNRVMNGCK